MQGWKPDGIMIKRKIGKDRRIYLPKKLFREMGAGAYYIEIYKDDPLYFKLYKRFPIITAFGIVVEKKKLERSYTSIPVFLPKEAGKYRNETVVAVIRKVEV